MTTETGYPYGPTSSYPVRKNVVPIQSVNKRPTSVNKGRPGSFQILNSHPLTGSAGELWYLAYYDAGIPQWALMSGGSSTGEFPITRFTVGPVGYAAYQTIATAITAASSAGGGSVYIQNGTYTENLTLASNVDLIGTGWNLCNIVGSHTPPASGTFMAQNLTFTSATDALSSEVAGTCAITFEDCVFDLTSGYICDLVNWTGPISIFECDSIGDNDGVINNTGVATITIGDSIVGVGTSNAMVVSGPMILNGTQINCALFTQSAASFQIDDCQFSNRISINNTSTGIISSSRISSGVLACIAKGSTAALTLTNNTFTSSNTNALDGAGNGPITMSGNVFTSSKGIAGTLVINSTSSSQVSQLLYTNMATTTTAGAATSGTVTLVGGTATISTTAVLTGSKIRLTRLTIGATGAAALGNLCYGTIVNATSFVINSALTATATSLATTDVSTVMWEIIG